MLSNWVDYSLWSTSRKDIFDAMSTVTGNQTYCPVELVENVSVAHHSISAVCVINLLPLHAANCSDSTVPINGSIEAYQNTSEGAEIFFSCNPGFVPAGRMRAVCGANGRWNPDPATFVCTCEAAYV